jgi:phage tail sheath protein FI
VSYPWFAPAGFNRAALDFVKNVSVRLNVSDRDALYDSRINPIATFPRLGFVIFGQKTLQIKKSALDRVNVRRLLLEVKRIIIGIANRLVFEQNTPAVRNRFVSDSVFQLGLIQTQAGLEGFQVVMNETNNTQEDIDLNRLNGRIVIVPTRSIEYIAIDFIITNAGVQFV